ncbi:hypothetical protein COOONC_21460 [Cooperia oncophora]
MGDGNQHYFRMQRTAMKLVKKTNITKVVLSSILQQCKPTPTLTDMQTVEEIPCCAKWMQNGFCNSTFYSKAYKMQYCGRPCGMC